MRPLISALAAAASAAAAWGWFEAGWVRTRVLEVPIAGLPAELDGLRIGHLSDFHLGVVGRGPQAVERGVAWMEERRPDLVCITGDLLSHPKGEGALRALVRRLDHPYVVLGNHDVAVSRDPFSQAVELGALEGATLLRDQTVEVELRGRRIQLVGVDPRSWPLRSQPAPLADPTADLRILLCHFPDVVRRLRPGGFQLVLAGHLHAGQINLPHPRGRFHLAHPRSRKVKGIHRHRAAVVHISPGLGTTFVPFRFCARPEATELRLRKEGDPHTSADPSPRENP
jgi:predicted MPP superfamily phosphohydrolase